MPFQLNFGKSRKLFGAVSDHYDRDLYWGALSLAKFLDYRVPYQFARIHSTAQLKDVVARAEPYSKSLLNTRLMRHDDVLRVLARSQSKRAKSTHERLSGGRFHVREKKKDPFFPIVELCSRSDPLAVEFEKWILLLKMQVDFDADEEIVGSPTPSAPVTTTAADPVTTTTTTTATTATAATAAAAATTTTADSKSVFHYSPQTPPPPPFLPVSPPFVVLNRSDAAAAAAAAAFSHSSSSAFRPYSPTDPPYETTTTDEATKDARVFGTFPGQQQPLHFSPPMMLPPPPPLLPPKKRVYCPAATNETDDGIVVWLSGIPPRKVIVLQGNTSLEFMPSKQ